MRSGYHAFEVIAPVLVGDREAAVLEHDADVRNAGRDFAGLAGAGGDPSDDRHAIGHDIALDIHDRRGDRCAAENITGYRAVDRMARRRVGPDGHGISHPPDRTTGQVVQTEGQPRAIGRDRYDIIGALAIDADGIGAQSQPP